MNEQEQKKEWQAVKLYIAIGFLFIVVACCGIARLAAGIESQLKDRPIKVANQSVLT